MTEMTLSVKNEIFQAAKQGVKERQDITVKLYKKEHQVK